MTVVIHTDGSFKNGIGGWGYVVMDANGNVKEGMAGAKCQNAWQMEMMAIIRSLEFVKSAGQALVVTDCGYIVNWYDNREALSAKHRLWFCLNEASKRVDTELLQIPSLSGVNRQAHDLANKARRAAKSVYGNYIPHYSHFLPQKDNRAYKTSKKFRRPNKL